jgi:hypothetical protein
VNTWWPVQAGLPLGEGDELGEYQYMAEVTLLRERSTVPSLKVSMTWLLTYLWNA